jgi:hypothetical protein
LGALAADPGVPGAVAQLFALVDRLLKGSAEAGLIEKVVSLLANDQNEVDVRIDRIFEWFEICRAESRLGNLIAPLVSLLTAFGKEQFGTVLGKFAAQNSGDFSADSQEERVSKLAIFASFVHGLPADWSDERSRLLAEPLAADAFVCITQLFPDPEHGKAQIMEFALGHPAVSVMFRMLAGLARGHEPTQAKLMENEARIIRAAVQLSDVDGIGEVARDFLGKLTEEPSLITKEFVESLRKKEDPPPEGAKPESSH